MDRRDEMREFGGLLPEGAKVDEEKMILEFVLEDDEGEEHEYELPCRYGVCDTCQGKGSHVNPSIDAHGISAREFDEDPEFREHYFSGVYDVPCYECGGKRVTPQIDRERADPKVLELLEEWIRSECEYRALCAAERRAEGWYR